MYMYASNIATTEIDSYPINCIGYTLCTIILYRTCTSYPTEVYHSIRFHSESNDSLLVNTSNNHVIIDDPMIDIPPQPSNPSDEAALFIEQYRSELQLNHLYYIISAVWFQQWCIYTGYNGDATQLSSGNENNNRALSTRPGPIDCTSIIIPDRSWYEIKKSSVNELIILNQSAYTLLSSWYGIVNNIEIKRKCIAVGFHRELRIDLYPIFLKLNILQLNSANEIQSMILPYNEKTRLIDIINENYQKNYHIPQRPPSYLSGATLDGRLWVHAESLNQPSTLQINELQRVYSDGTQNGISHSTSELDATEQHAAESADSWQLLDITRYDNTLDELEYDSGITLLLEYRNSRGEWSKSSSNKPWPIIDWSVGDKCDALDSQHKWYQATVKQVNNDNTLLIGFDGWPDKFDEIINPITSKMRFAPVNTITCGPHKKAVNKSINNSFDSRNRYNSQNSDNTTNTQRGAVGLRNLGNTCFDINTEVLVWITDNQNGWMSGDELMKWWYSVERPNIRIASMRTVDGVNYLVYNQLVDVVSPFVYDSKYGVDEHPVRIRVTTPKATLDLLVTPDHNMYAAPVMFKTGQKRVNDQNKFFGCQTDVLPYRTVTAVDLLQTPKDCPKNFRGWHIPVSCPLLADPTTSLPPGLTLGGVRQEPCFTLPSLLTMKQKAIDAQRAHIIPVNNYIYQQSPQQYEREYTFVDDEMDTWLLFIGFHLADGSSEIRTIGDSQTAYLKYYQKQFPQFIRTVWGRLQQMKHADGQYVFNAHQSRDSDIWCETPVSNDPDAIHFQWYNLVLVVWLWLIELHTSNQVIYVPIPVWLWYLTPRQVKLVLLGMAHGDGTVSKSDAGAQYCEWCMKTHRKFTYITTVSKKHADEIQRLCMHAGWSSTVTFIDTSHYINIKTGHTEPGYYVVSLNTTETTVNTHSLQKNRHYINLDKTDAVRKQKFWCVTTAEPSHVILVRRRVNDYTVDSPNKLAKSQTATSKYVVGDKWVTAIIGNCFMNSTLQCLSNTAILTPYFESKQYMKELNRTNPLGWKGRIAEEYGALIHDMWSGQYNVVTPRMFKQVIGEFQPRFSGYAQHDSSELLSFILDGLHEDLNRVINKPFVPNIESNGRPDAVVSAEAWSNHLLRNQSKIVDTVQGQLKSTVVCPTCNKQSVTFDPFTFLSVPIPGTMTESHIITLILSVETLKLSNGSMESPLLLSIKINKNATVLDFKQEIIKVLHNPHITNPSQLNIAEVYNNSIYAVYNDTASCDWGKSDTMYCYEHPVDNATAGDELVDNDNEPVSDDDMMSTNTMNKSTNEYKPIYMQFIKSDPNHTSTTYIQHNSIAPPVLIGFNPSEFHSITMSDIVHKIKNAMLPIVSIQHQAGFSNMNILDICSITLHTELKGTSSPVLTLDNTTDMNSVIQLNKYIRHNNTPNKFMSYSSNHQMNTNMLSMKCHIQYDKTDILITDNRAIKKHSSLIQYESNSRESQHVTLLDCIDDFLSSEILGVSEAWYCSICKQHKQASKKFDLFKLPDILIIHLKRFLYTNLHREKIDQMIEFPTQNLDLSPYMQHTGLPDNQLNNQYDLYAVSNHFGGLGGGHYTAFAQNLIDQQWYRLDDSIVTRVDNVNDVKTPAAYVLFYKRKHLSQQNTNSRIEQSNGMNQ